MTERAPARSWLRQVAAAVVLTGALAALPRPAVAEAIEQTPGVWHPMGPAAATVFALDRDPFDRQVMLAGTYFGGLYRSADYGVTWSWVPSPFASRIVLAIAFDRQTAGAIYASTFEAGLYKSVDGGASWTQANTGLADLNVLAVATDPFAAGTVIAATAGAGVFRSTDGGGTWTPVLARPSRALLFDARHPGVVLAGADGEVLRSADHGETWARLGTMDGTAESVTSLVESPIEEAGYLATTDGAVYQYVTASAVWANQKGNLPPTAVHQVVPLLDGTYWMAVTDLGIYVSLRPPYGPVWFRWASFETHPRRLWISEGGAILHVALRHGSLKASVDFGGTWFDANLGMQNVFTGALAARDQGGETIVYAGTDLGVSLTAPSFGEAAGVPNWYRAASLREESVFRIVPHPTEPGVLFAGTERAGVWKSVDWGGTWTQSSHGIFPRDVFALAQSRTEPATFYAGTSSGVFLSRDGGRSWRATATRVLHPRDVTAVAVDPIAAASAWFGTGDGNVFRTFDAGETWMPADTGLPRVRIEQISIGPRGVYVLNVAGQMFVRTAANDWSPVAVPYPVKALQQDAARVLVGTLEAGLLVSTDGGPWQSLSGGLLLPWILSLAIDPSNASVLFAGSNLLQKSVDGGVTWFAANGGLPLDPVVAVAVDPVNPSRVYAALHAHGLYRSDDAGVSWTQVRGGPTWGGVLIDRADGDVIVGTRFEGIVRSADDGLSWQSSSSGLSIFTRGLAIDTTNPQRMYAGGLHGGFYRSLDGGGTWTLLGLEDKWIEDIAIDPGNPAILYAGSTTGVSRSTDGGATWTDTGPPTGATTGMFVLALAIDPRTPATIYAGTGGYGVWKSTNRGADWTFVNTGLTNSLVLALAIDPATPSTLYAGTAGGGVFVSDDGAASWRPLGTLRNGIVTALALDPRRPGRLFAGTEGGGVFSFVRP